MALKIKSIDGITNIVVESAASANNVPASGIVGLEDSDSIKIINEDGKVSFSAATSEPIDLSEYYKKTETSGKEELSAKFDTKQDILNFKYNDNDAISAINGSALAIPEIDLSNYYTKTETSGKEELSAEFNTKQDIIANKKDSSIPYLETINSEPSWEVIESSHINAHGTAEEGELYDIPINGRTYKVVCINGKLWLAENYVNEAKATYTHPKYGSYFNKATINSVTFVPQGWHIPSKEEWQSLIDYTENHEKYLSTTDWHQGTDYVQGTNELKLNILPGSEYNLGRQEISSEYYNARFWTSTDEILTQSTGKQRVYAKISNYIGYNSKIISFDWDGPGSLYYFPVRLIKDDLEVPAPDGWKKFNSKNFMAIADDEGNTFKDFYLKTSAAQQLYQVKGDYASSADVTVLNTYYGLTTTGWKDISTNYYDKQSVDNMIAGIDLSNYYTKSETSGKTELTSAFNNKMNLFQAGTDLIFLNGKLGVHTNGKILNSNYAFVEGYNTSADGAYTHAEGQSTLARNNNSHAEGSNTSAIGQTTHAEGSYTLADGSCSHAEGTSTYAHGHDSHAEGGFTTANNFYAHAEGTYSIANATASHAEGYYTSAIGNYSHSEGYQTSAVGEYSHAEGYKTSANGNDAHAEGSVTYSVAAAHAEGYRTSAMIVYTHAEGEYTVAASTAAHSEGSYTFANGKYSHAEGGRTVANGLESHSEGYYTSALADYSHAEGGKTFISSGALAAHTEGSATSAKNTYAHAEGVKSIANSIASHAEGTATSAVASYSHTEGYETYANGSYGSHAQGYRTSANGKYSFAGGCYTLAKYDYETVLGKYNLLERTDSPLFVIGNGSSTANRSDAFVVTQYGIVSGYDFVANNGNKLSECITTLPTITEYVAGTGIVFTAGTGTDAGKTVIEVDSTNYKLITTAEYAELTAAVAIISANSARWVLTPAS